MIKQIRNAKETPSLGGTLREAAHLMNTTFEDAGAKLPERVRRHFEGMQWATAALIGAVFARVISSSDLPDKVADSIVDLGRKPSIDALVQEAFKDDPAKQKYLEQFHFPS